MVIFFGPAGSGKSVQGQMLASTRGWNWISVGQLIRDANDTELNEIMATGKLIPSAITNRLVDEKLANLDQNKVVVDGYPRDLEQAEWLIKQHQAGVHEVNLGIVFDVPREELISRLEKRGRYDDTAAAIEERLCVFNDSVKPVIQYLIDNGIVVKHINGVGPIEEIHSRIVVELNELNLV